MTPKSGSASDAQVKAKEIFRQYVATFCVAFENKLSQYKRFVWGQPKKDGQIQKAAGPLTGGLVAGISSLLGVPALAKSAYDAGDKVGGFAADQFSCSLQGDKATNILRLTRYLLCDENKERKMQLKETIRCGAILTFIVYEQQLMTRINEASDPLLVTLVHNAIDRIMNYINKVYNENSQAILTEEMITCGVIYGKTKIANKAKSKIKELTRLETWSGSKMYRCAGVVDQKGKLYCRIKFETLDPYGCRRMLPNEGETQEFQNAYKPYNPKKLFGGGLPKVKYSYLFSFEVKEELLNFCKSQRSSKSAQRVRVMYHMTNPPRNFSSDIRKDELSRLCSYVSEKSPNVTWVHGLPAVGKTSLAKKFASHSFTGDVYWIRAETYDIFLKDLRDLARTFGIECSDDHLLSEIYQKIYNSRIPSLMVFDNALCTFPDDVSRNIDNYFPQEGCENIHLIVTSTEDFTRKGVSKIKLNPLKLEDSVKLLTASLEEETYKDVPGSLESLANQLGNFPLQLQLAISYIREENDCEGQLFTVQDYIDIYSTDSKNILNSSIHSQQYSEIGTAYGSSSFSSWLLTVEKISRMDGGLDALQLLQMIAYLDPDDIPVSIFDMCKYSKPLRTLIRYSLVDKKEVETEVGQRRSWKYSIHRLVQRVIRIYLQDNQNERKGLETRFSLVLQPHIDQMISDEILEFLGNDEILVYPHRIGVHLAFVSEDCIQSFLPMEICMENIESANDELCGYNESGDFVRFTLSGRWVYRCFGVEFYENTEGHFELCGNYRLYRVL